MHKRVRLEFYDLGIWHSYEQSWRQAEAISSTYWA